MHTIALFGGTFDPIHNGHLFTSLKIQEQFNFDSYRFLPCKIPVIKGSAHATTEQRITMIRLAIKQYPQFCLDLREVNRSTPSYMVETLESLRKEYQDSSITLVLGYDAFLNLPQWYSWQKIMSLANLLVINRKKSLQEDRSDLIKTILMKQQVGEKKNLLQKTHGAIYEFDAGDYPISSTEIRFEIKNQTDLSTKLPKEVCQYIIQQRLYQ